MYQHAIHSSITELKAFWVEFSGAAITHSALGIGSMGSSLTTRQPAEVREQ